MVDSVGTGMVDGVLCWESMLDGGLCWDRSGRWCALLGQVW